MTVKSALLVILLLGLSAQGLAENVTVSEVKDQTAVEVTAYNNNLALIKDVRTIKLPKGRGELRFMDVAAHINPVTVLVKSLSDPGKFAVLRTELRIRPHEPDQTPGQIRG